MNIAYLALAWLASLVLTAGGAFAYGQSVEQGDQARRQVAANRVASNESLRKSEIQSVNDVARAGKQRRAQQVAVHNARESQRALVSDPPLSGAWRVLHDAAARGEPADRGSMVDAAAVAAADAASTVAGNYANHNAEADRVTGLQDFIRANCVATAKKD